MNGDEDAFEIHVRHILNTYLNKIWFNKYTEAIEQS